MKLKSVYIGLRSYYLRIKSRKITEGKSCINILKKFPMYEARGFGLYKIRAKLTIQSINQVIPALAGFKKKIQKNEDFKDELLKVLKKEDDILDLQLKELFNKYGSDKASTHNYYKIYSYLLSTLEKPKRIFEIGLGTNNTDIVSTMGAEGKPGASLRAFRDFLPECTIHGADYDKRILFTEDRIKTYFVDQTDQKTFSNLMIEDEFDLMIDDGLHSPNANLHSLKFFLDMVSDNGYAVIEDIHISNEPIWEVVSQMISEKYTSAFIQTQAACMFIVKRGY